MHTIEVFGWNKRDPKEGRIYTYPGDWSECTPAQLGTIAALTSATPALDTPEVQALPKADRQRVVEMAEAHLRLHLLRELSNMAGSVFERIDPADLLAVRMDDIGAQHVALLPSLDWCMQEPVYDLSLVPTLEVDGRKFVGPTDRLSRFVVLQWGFADALIARCAESGRAEDLDLALGALYHYADQPWDNDGIEERAAQLATLDDRIKLAALLNYRALRATLPRRYPRCFRGGKADPYGVQGTVVRLAGPKFGTVEQAGRANMHDVLVHVEQSLADQEELERKSK